MAKDRSTLLVHGAKEQTSVLWDFSSIYWPLSVTFIDKKKVVFLLKNCSISIILKLCVTCLSRRCLRRARTVSVFTVLDIRWHCLWGELNGGAGTEFVLRSNSGNYFGYSADGWTSVPLACWTVVLIPLSEQKVHCKVTASVIGMRTSKLPPLIQHCWCRHPCLVLAPVISQPPPLFPHL